MDIKVIDNFLSQSEFEIVLKNTIEREDLQLTFVSNINNLSTNSEDYWSWYLIHMVYSKTASPKSFLMDAVEFPEVESFTFDDVPLPDEPESEIYTNICDMFIPRFKQVANFRSMIRIKINAYPYTNIVKEHKDHFDSYFHHTGAVFSFSVELSEVDGTATAPVLDDNEVVVTAALPGAVGLAIAFAELK